MPSEVKFSMYQNKIPRQGWSRNSLGAWQGTLGKRDHASEEIFSVTTPPLLG